MKALSLFLLSLLVLASNSINAQSGWIQTQINPGIGYNLTTTDSVILASTYDGIFSTTSDGMPWFSKGPANHAVYDVLITEHSMLAATVDGIFRSLDKGNTWTLISNTIKSSGVGGTQGSQVFTKNGATIFIHTWAQGLFRSDDDGTTWQLLSVGTNSGYSGDLGEWATCIYAFDGNIFMGAPGGDIGIYYSTDNGNSWNQAKSNTPVQNNDLLFFYADKDTLYAGGFRGLYRSLDKGVNWVPQYRNIVDSEGHLIGIGTFRDMISYQQNLVAAIDAKSIQISQDGGKNWTDFNRGLISEWTFIDLELKPPYIWALTSFFGNAYRRSLTDIITTIKPELNNKNNLTILEQNFPNPVKTTTTIRYIINNTEKVELSVFDIFGKEIITLVNKTQYPGTYETLIDAKDLKNGTYFYRLNSSIDSKVKKFIVLHNP